MEKTLRNAIDNGLRYLIDHQFPNGEFVSYFGGDAALLGWLRPDRTLFSTALICHCLSFVKNEPSEELQEKSMLFLGGEKSKHGLWNHFANWHPYRNLLPCDIDDTSCISVLYKEKGTDFPSPSNIPILAANRTGNGLFYTWFIFRWKLLTNKTFVSIALRRLPRALVNLVFWKSVEANPNDVDAVVNANVLYYLGETEITRPIIQYIISIIDNGREGECDLWYRDKLIVYYFFSRNYFKGVQSLQPIVAPIIERTLASVNNDGSIGNTVLDTAWAICTLINLRYDGPEIAAAAAFLLEKQENDGCWPRWIAYWGGPKKLTGYGSEELTTAFCLEALSRYLSKRTNNS